MFRNEGQEAAAGGPGLHGRDVEYVGHHGEHLDVGDGAAGGLWCQLEAGLALSVAGHAQSGHVGTA